ncbi:hypothetical protein ACA910_008384 [Epithemia clementina (nom. ined.)]
MKFAAASLALFASCVSAFQLGKAPSSAKTSMDAALNGWVPDAKKFAYGLPGSLDPVPDFDPLNFAETADLNLMKQYREAELQHGRVAMLAVIGFLVTEEPIEFHPLFEAGNKDIGPAIRHLDEVRAVAPIFFEILAVVIGALEFNRALIGWTKPTGENKPALNEDYFPGDVGFDPLGLRPSDPTEFLELHTKELQNGRLAMLGAAGIVAQELVNGKEIFVNLGLAEDRFDPSTLPIQF